MLPHSLTCHLKFSPSPLSTVGRGGKILFPSPNLSQGDFLPHLCGKQFSIFGTPNVKVYTLAFPCRKTMRHVSITWNCHVSTDRTCGMPTSRGSGDVAIDGIGYHMTMLTCPVSATVIRCGVHCWHVAFSSSIERMIYVPLFSMSAFLHRKFIPGAKIEDI
jgi:hypothetical protein